VTALKACVNNLMEMGMRQLNIFALDCIADYFSEHPSISGAIQHFRADMYGVRM
jgi:hypothetical protein